MRVKSILGLTESEPLGVFFDDVVATTLTPGYERYLDSFLGSLRRVGCSLPIVVFSVDETPSMRKVLDYYSMYIDIFVIPAFSLHSDFKNQAAVSKMAMYSISRYLGFGRVMFVEADFLFIQSPDKLFQQFPRHSVLPNFLLLSSGDRNWDERPIDAACSMNRLFPEELQAACNQPLPEKFYMTNGGLYLGDCEALKIVEDNYENCDQEKMLGLLNHELHFREELVFNYFNSQLDCPVRIPFQWNINYMNTHTDLFNYSLPQNIYQPFTPDFGGTPIGALHFSGEQKQLYQDILDYYRHFDYD